MGSFPPPPPPSPPPSTRDEPIARPDRVRIISPTRSKIEIDIRGTTSASGQNLKKKKKKKKVKRLNETARVIIYSKTFFEVRKGYITSIEHIDGVLCHGSI